MNIIKSKFNFLKRKYLSMYQRRINYIYLNIYATKIIILQNI
jgi:hypothetical protein